MPVYMPPLNGVLERIRAVSAADPVDDGTGEWFTVKSRTQPDAAVYGKLQSAWSRIVGGDGSSFALIYCQGGSKSGVWLHFLATPALRAEYAQGCHQIASWS